MLNYSINSKIQCELNEFLDNILNIFSKMKLFSNRYKIIVIEWQPLTCNNSYTINSPIFKFYK